MQVYNTGMKENKSDNCQLVSGFVNKLLGDKGLTKKISDKQLNQAGLNFESWSIKDKKAYFFTVPNDRNINYLKENNLNVTRSQKFCIDKNKYNVKSKITKYYQNDDLTDRESPIYYLELVNTKLETGVPYILDIIKST